MTKNALRMVLVGALCFVASFCSAFEPVKPDAEKLAAMYRLGDLQRAKQIRAAEYRLNTDAQYDLEIALRGRYYVKNLKLPAGYYFDDDISAPFANREAEEKGLAAARAEIERLKKLITALKDLTVPVVPEISGRWLDVGEMGTLSLPVEIKKIIGPGECIAVVKTRRDGPGEPCVLIGFDIPLQLASFMLPCPIVVSGKQFVDGKDGFIIQPLELPPVVRAPEGRSEPEPPAAVSPELAKDRQRKQAAADVIHREQAAKAKAAAKKPAKRPARWTGKTLEGWRGN